MQAAIILRMIPVAFQTPAAVIMLVGGLLACFAGYRVFRVVLAIYGFILGAVLASSLMPAEQTLWMILVWVGGGLAGALILFVAYYAGVALLGAAVGVGAAHVVSAAFDTEPAVVVVIGLAIAGALVALVLQRYVIVLATAFGGAHTAVIGGMALWVDPEAARAAAREVFRVYPFDPMPGTLADVWVSLALGVAGVIVQLAVTARRR